MKRIPDSIRRAREKWRDTARRRPRDVPRPGPGQESVWDYPRPPAVVACARPVRVEFAGEVIAATDGALKVCETASPPTYYLPPGDVRRECLIASGRRTLCEWKGQASYFHVRIGERQADDAVWCYREPWPGFEAIAGYLAFMPGAMDACWVGEDQVTPQPGRFYGGWVTPDVLGPFKGEPGTGHW